jgi:hypothetical protein
MIDPDVLSKAILVHSVVKQGRMCIQIDDSYFEFLLTQLYNFFLSKA